MLLDDTQPEEAKTLLEEKLKKVTTERAPVAGQQNARAGGRSGASGRSLLEGLVDPTRSATGNAVMDQLLRSQGRPPIGTAEPHTPGANRGMGSGAHAAAGVLTALDEDGENDEEARVPDAFEYFSDGSDEDDDDDE